MNKHFLLFVGLFFSLQAIAQTGIGTTNPHPSAKLDIASDRLGFLPPRIALTATNSASPITSPATGLVIFNTATAGTTPNNVLPGYYYWDGSKWNGLVDQSSLNSFSGFNPNYAQSNASAVTKSSVGDIIVSQSITTSGRPVQIIATGDANPGTSGAWVQLQLYRDNTAIGKKVQAESSLNNENVPYCLNFIDNPTTPGSYTYSVRIVGGGSGGFGFGESDGNHLTLLELGAWSAGTMPVSKGGTGNSSFSSGSVMFSDGTNITQKNANLFWDNSNNRLGVGNNAPTATLDVSGSLAVSGSTTFKSNISVGTGAGAEGGEMQLAYAQTGNTLTGSAVSVDVYQDRLRIFEGGGTSRGVFLDLSKAPTGVGGELLWKVNSTIQSSFNINATITAPTLGTRSINQISYRLNGDKYRLTYRLGATAGTSHGSGDYLFNLPTGLTFNTASGYNPVYTGGTWSPNIAAMAPYFIPAAGGLIIGGVWTMQMHIVPYNSTQFRVVLAANTGGYGFWSNGYFAIAQDMMWDAEFEIWAQ